MSVDYGKYKNERYVYLPKMGENKTFKLLYVEEVTGGQDRFHFTMKEKKEVVGGGEAVVDVNLGYHIEAELEEQVELQDGTFANKILSVTSLAAFISVFKKHELNDGDHVKIYHVGKGEWEVTRLDDAGEEVAWDE